MKRTKLKPAPETPAIGRPPLPGGPSQIFRFRVAISDLEAIKATAKRLDVTPSELMRRAALIFCSLPASVQGKAAAP
jgi:hypothetical protein